MKISPSRLQAAPWLLALFLVACSTLASAAATPFRFKAESEALGYSEPVPIRAFVRGWHAPLGAGSNASAVIRESVTLGYAQWRISRIYQDLYDVKASRDAARLYHRVSNHLPFEPAETFDVALEVRFARSLGWRLARDFELGEAGELELGLTRWHGMKLTSGSLLATATATGNSSKDYQYSGTLDYYYGKDALFDRPERGADGSGWGLDLGWRGTWQNWRWDLQGNNLFAFIDWQQALHTSGQFNSATEQVDAQGQSSFNPTLLGREDRRDLHQRLPVDARLQVLGSYGAYEAGASSQYLPAGSNLILEGGRRWGGIAARAGLMVLPKLGAGAELSGYGFRLRYFSDALALPKARWAEFRLSWAYPF